MMLAATPAAAHRGHSTLSVVEIDAGTGAVVVTHDMAAHDAEPALVLIAPRAQPSLDDPDALAALTAYIGRRFMLSSGGGKPIVLTLKNTRLKGDELRLIYTGRLRKPAKLITVTSDIFTDVHRDQENQVNVRRAKVTRTALFRRSGDPQTIRFE